MNRLLATAVRRLRSHPTDGDLVQYLDQELGSRDQAWISRHMGACWSCRHRLYQLRAGIHAYMEERECRNSQWNDDRNDRNARFLLALAAEERRASVRPTPIKGRLSMVTALAAAGVALAAIAFLQRAAQPMPVSARELLLSTQRAELHAEPVPVRPASGDTIVLRIARQGRDGWRTAFAEPGHSGFRSGDSTVTRDLQQALSAAGLEYGPLLSAAQFEHWATAMRATLAVEKLTTDEGEFWRVTAHRQEDRLADRLSILIRSRDKRVCEQQLTFGYGADVQRYVITYDTVSPTVSSRTSTTTFPIPKSATSIPTATTDPVAKTVSTRALLALVVEAHHVLHREGLCLSGAVSVVREQGAVLVRGVVEYESDRRRLQDQFLGQPLVRFDVQIASEAQRAPMPAHADMVLTGDSPTPEDALRSALQHRLRQRLTPSLSDSEAEVFTRRYGNEAIQTAQNVLQHAWAFRRLREDFLPSQLEQLAPEYRILLQEIARSRSRSRSWSTQAVGSVASYSACGYRCASAFRNAPVGDRPSGTH